MKNANASNTQQRAICPACFNQQALRNGRLVQHGYTRPQQWHQNVGTCAGTGRPHFGTEAGRDYTREIAAGLLRTADANEADAAQVLDPTSDVAVFTTKRGYGGRREVVRVEQPTAVDRTRHAERLQAEATACRAAAADYAAKADAWTPAEPIAVAVAPKAAAVIHWRTARRWAGHGKACAASAMGAYRARNTSSDLARVTCEKCKALAARLGAAEGSR